MVSTGIIFFHVDTYSLAICWRLVELDYSAICTYTLNLVSHGRIVGRDATYFLQIFSTLSNRNLNLVAKLTG